MFKHLLVPLDGSSLAEAALPAAHYLAHTLHASITLLHVIEQSAPDQVHGEPHITEPTEAGRYLAGVARTFPAGAPVAYHVHSIEARDVAQAIIDHAEELAVDLIVMCMHGHSGLRTWLFGTIAQRVIALGMTPVLLVNPGATESPPAFVCRRLLAPLDGNVEHEQGLAVAVGLAQACGAEILLLMVVPTLNTLARERLATARLLPGAVAALLDLTEQDAGLYLQRHVEQLAVQGMAAAATVRRGDPAQVIVRYARQAQADLLVLGTHGKSHLDAFWSGSTTPKVSARTKAPLLLVPVHDGQASAPSS